MMITESSLSSSASETYMDIFSALWLGDYVGSFLNSGGKGLYYFHYLPLQIERGCNDSPGTFGMFSVDQNYQVQQYLAQYFASVLINTEWIKGTGAEYHVFPAKGDLSDGAGHVLVTAYALRGPDDVWSLMMVNRDQFTSHQVRVSFRDEANRSVSALGGPVAISTFGRAQYQWHPITTKFMAQAPRTVEESVILNTRGWADPDGPIVHESRNAEPGTSYEVPAASIVILRGKLSSKK